MAAADSKVIVSLNLHNYNSPAINAGRILRFFMLDREAKTFH